MKFLPALIGFAAAQTPLYNWSAANTWITDNISTKLITIDLDTVKDGEKFVIVADNKEKWGVLLLGDKPIYKTDDYASDNGFFTKIATGYKNANGIDIKTDENKRIDFTAFEVAETPTFTVADKDVLELTLTGDYS